MSTSDLSERLPFASSLTPAQRQRLNGLFERVDSAPGEVLFREGDNADDVYFLLEGRVALSIRVPGVGATTMLSLGPGEMLGWSGLREHERVATASVTEPLLAARAGSAALWQACNDDHELGFVLMRHAFEQVSGRLHDTRLQWLDMFGERADNREASSP